MYLKILTVKINRALSKRLEIFNRRAVCRARRADAGRTSRLLAGFNYAKHYRDEVISRARDETKLGEREVVASR